MRKFLLASLVTTAAVAANASISLDMRTDYLSQTYNSDAIAGGSGVDNTKFYFQTGRVDFQGKLNDETSYRLRWRFAGKSHNLQTRDNTFQDVDYAYIANKMHDGMTTFTLGKFGSDIGGFEGNTNGADLYLNSEAYAGTSSLGGYSASGAKTLTGYSNLLYYTGAKFAFTFADQDINIQAGNIDTANGRGPSTVTNGDHTTTGTAAGKFDQDQALWGIAWKGKFTDNWMFRASYHTMKTEPAAGLDGKIDYAAIGGQFQNDAWLIQLDYLMNSYKETSAVETGTDNISSISLSGKWMFSDTWAALLKVVYSTEKFDDATSADNKYTSEGLAFEYKPKKEDNFRYHIAYNNRTMAPDQGSDRNLQEVIVGARIMADFLK